MNQSTIYLYSPLSTHTHIYIYYDIQHACILINFVICFIQNKLLDKSLNATHSYTSMLCVQGDVCIGSLHIYRYTNGHIFLLLKCSNLKFCTGTQTSVTADGTTRQETTRDKTYSKILWETCAHLSNAMPWNVGHHLQN